MMRRALVAIIGCLQDSEIDQNKNKFDVKPYVTPTRPTSIKTNLIGTCRTYAKSCITLMWFFPLTTTTDSFSPNSLCLTSM